MITLSGKIAIEGILRESERIIKENEHLMYMGRISSDALEERNKKHKEITIACKEYLNEIL